MAIPKHPRFSRLARLAPALAIGFTTLLAGCGSSGDDAPAFREIDAAGGTLGAASLSLTIPPAALGTPTSILAEEVPAEAGELARYRFVPAGLNFAVPASLNIDPAARPTLAGLTVFPAGARLFWQVGDERWLIPGAAAGSALTASLPTLGYRAADRFASSAPAAGPKDPIAASTARRASSLKPNADAPAPLPVGQQGGDLVVAELDCDRHVDELGVRLSDPSTVGSFELAGGIDRDLRATLDACLQQQQIDRVTASSCAGLAAARAAASVTITSFEALNRITLALVTARGLVDEAGATCPNDVPGGDDALIATRTSQVLDAVVAEFAQGDFEDATLRDITRIATYESSCQLAGLGAVCDRFPTEIYGRFINGLRSSAFNECAVDQAATTASQLFAALGFSETGTQLLEYAGITAADLESDLSYCRNPSLELRVFDDFPIELVDRRVTLEARTGEVGDYSRSVAVNLPPRGALEIGGIIPAPVCPNGTLADVELVVRVNDTELARREIQGTGFRMTPSISIMMTAVQAALGDANGNAPFTLKLNREGSGCVIQEATDAVPPVPATSLSPARAGQPALPEIRGFNQPLTLFEIVGSGRGATLVNRISAGASSSFTSSSCAVTLAGGAARCWGANANGQLGNGQRSTGPDDLANATPSDVIGLGSGVASISSGGLGLIFGSRGCAVTTAGAAQCWGGNFPGALGIDSNDLFRTSPATVSGLGSGVAEVAVGGLHACARTVGGAVRCWGSNSSGQLGIGNIDNTRIYEFNANPGGEPQIATSETDFRSTPVEVSGLGSGVVDLAAGSIASCALLDNSQVRCWGLDLTNPTVTSLDVLNDQNTEIDPVANAQAAPVEIAGLGSTVSQIAIGGYHACALLGDGSVRCWGNNSAGQLGDGSTTGRATPVAVTGLPARAVAVATGLIGSCALLETGRVHCWGSVLGRTISDPDTGTSLSGLPISGGPGEIQPLAQEVPGFGDTVAEVSVGDTHACVYQQDGALRCLGNNQSGALGDGTLIDRRLPVGVLRFP